MSRSLRRYEVLLPLQFNDGQPVPNDLIAALLFQVQDRFGAISSETQIIHGNWQHEGQVYRDDLMRLFVDVPDTPESRQFFVDFKETLKTSLKQIDIWITTHPIEAL